MKNGIVGWVFLSLAVMGESYLSPDVRYRIRSGYDGKVLTALQPSLTSTLKLKLGPVQTQDWNHDPNQMWTFHNRGNETNSGDTYWMKPKEGVLNVLTGVPGEEEVTLLIKEITENSGTFTIKGVSSNNNLCLENAGEGLEVIFKSCNELNTAQQWDIEDPSNPHLRLFTQLLNLFNKIL